MTTPEAVRRALAGVTDPLLGQNLMELGMVHEVRVARGGRVTIRLSLPSQHWPAANDLIRAARSAAAGQPDVVTVDVKLMDEPPWTPYHLSSALKAPLGLPASEPPSPCALTPSTGSRIRQRVRSVLGR
jgi:ATP-binding protein involved in chromosome partitioning